MSPVSGQFGWVDLATTDVEAARAFYQGLFGWQSRIMPTPMGPEYTVFTVDDLMVAGMGPQPPGLPPDTPSLWNSYVMVDDVDAAAAAAVAAGGSVPMPAMDVMDQGRMAMVADPSGAVVGLWQPMAHLGAELLDEEGALVWNELQTWSLAEATPFYATLFGWTWSGYDTAGYQASEEHLVADGYLMAELATKEGEDKGVAGAMAMPPGVPQGVPSYWMVYFGVEDCDTSLARALELGGQQLFPAMDMGPGRFAGVVDPTGAMFTLGHLIRPQPA